MDAAANMIEKAIIANPTYAEAYNNLGWLCIYSLHFCSIFVYRLGLCFEDVSLLLPF